MREFEFTCPFPLTLNHAWLQHGQRRFRKRDYIKYERDIAEILKGVKMDDGYYCVTIDLFPPNRRIYDADNRIKTLLDAMTQCGFWADDSLVNEIIVRKGLPIIDESCAVVSVKVMDNPYFLIPENYGLQTKVYKN